MRILHLANTPLSNAPANLASCQNRYGHEAQLLLARKNGRNKVFVGGDLWSDKPLEQLVSFFEATDILHFHNFTWNQEIFVKYPQLLQIAKAKKKVVQFHSARKAHEDFEGVLTDPLFKGRKLVIAQYHVREYPECEWVVPNPLPLHEDRYRILYKGKWGDCPPIHVSYAPSNAHLKGWDYKGYDVLEPYLRNLRRCGFVCEIITGVPYDECLSQKTFAHVGIEEFFTGSYHLSFLEYMALECATFGHMDALAKEAIRTIVGWDAFLEMPYFDVLTTEDITNQLKKFSMSPGLLRASAAASREWIHNHWHPKKLMPHFDEVYESL